MKPHKMSLLQKKAGQYTVLGQNFQATTEQDKWYDVYLECEGADVTVWRGESGGAMAQVLSTSSAEFLTSASLYFSMTGTNKYRYDNIKVLSDDLSESVTYAHNDANELTSMSDVNGTTSFTYDAWGRTATKSRSSLSATYAYRYGHKLYDVDSTFPDEGDVTYETGGDGKRRSRVAGADETWYNWDSGWQVISEEDDAVGDGTLRRMYTERTLAHVDGTDPSTGNYVYYTDDHLGSVRALHDQSKNLQGNREYSPYGSLLGASNLNLTTHGFTGHDWDATAAMYFAPFRHYNPSIGRWTMRDPLGMVDGPNLYAYVGGNPIRNVDLLGSTRMPRTGGDVHNHDGSCLNFDKLTSGAGDVHDSLPSGEVITVLKCMSKKLGGECLRVSGGTRPPNHPDYNPRSQHNTGNAADIGFRGSPDPDGCPLMCAAKDCGVKFGIVEPNHYHIDLGPARRDRRYGNDIEDCKCDEC